MANTQGAGAQSGTRDQDKTVEPGHQNAPVGPAVDQAKQGSHHGAGTHEDMNKPGQQGR